MKCRDSRCDLSLMSGHAVTILPCERRGGRAERCRKEMRDVLEKCLTQS
jgi:hypothetical protein